MTGHPPFITFSQGQGGRAGGEEKKKRKREGGERKGGLFSFFLNTTLSHIFKEGGKKGKGREGTGRFEKTPLPSFLPSVLPRPGEEKRERKGKKKKRERGRKGCPPLIYHSSAPNTGKGRGEEKGGVWGGGLHLPPQQTKKGGEGGEERRRGEKKKKGRSGYPTGCIAPVE